MRRIADMTSTALNDRGRELGSNLGAALILAAERHGRDREFARELVRIVVREIEVAADRLRMAGLSAPVIEAYRSACREGCVELMRRFACSRAAARRAA